MGNFALKLNLKHHISHILGWPQFFKPYNGEGQFELSFAIICHRGRQVVMWWAQSAPLVEIGLTELPKTGWGGTTLPASLLWRNTVGKRQACQIQIGSLVHFKGQTKLTMTACSIFFFFNILDSQH